MRGLLKPHFDHIETTVTPVLWTVPLAPEEAAQMFLDKAGPPLLMLRRMDEERRSQVVAACKRLWVENNIASEPDRTVIANEYLTVKAVRKATA